jgi:outer membrane protein OmpA-like peptidoglycan-associated protein
LQHLLPQNLVLNPSFEIVENKKPKDWEYTTLSPDFYSKVNNNLNSLIQAKSGGNCLGLYNQPGIIEIVQCKLKEPLIKSKIYEIKLWAAKAEFCRNGFFHTEIAFNNVKLPKSTKKMYALKHTNLFEQNQDTVKKIGEWHQFVGYYKAKGDENYISIGRFSSLKRGQKNTNNSLYENHVFSVNLIDGCSYIYYDSIEIKEFVMNLDSIELKHLYFDNNKSKLKEESYNSLNQLLSFLKIATHIKLDVIGHTDNEGNPKDNLILSKNRANAVAEYLVKNGINKNRISTNGFGDSKPKYSNSTEEGKLKNRRVEIAFN